MQLSSFDMDHYLAVIEERRKAIEKALQEDKEKLEVDIDRANATDMEEEWEGREEEKEDQ